MNNNKFFSLIVNSLLDKTEILKIEFVGDNLPTSNLQVTIKTGSGSVTLIYNYHGETVGISNNGKVKTSYILKLTSIMHEIEELVRA